MDDEYFSDGFDPGDGASGGQSQDPTLYQQSQEKWWKNWPTDDQLDQDSDGGQIVQPNSLEDSEREDFGAQATHNHLSASFTDTERSSRSYRFEGLRRGSQSDRQRGGGHDVSHSRGRDPVSYGGRPSSVNSVSSTSTRVSGFMENSSQKLPRRGISVATDRLSDSGSSRSSHIPLSAVSSSRQFSRSSSLSSRSNQRSYFEVVIF